MNRIDEIKQQMDLLQAELDGLSPHERMTARELGRRTETSPSTASRFKAGDLDGIRFRTLKKFMPFTRVCPLCEAPSDPEAWGGSSTPPQAEGEPKFTSARWPREEEPDAPPLDCAGTWPREHNR